MISLEKLKILTPLQKLPKNVGDLGKLIIAKGFESCPKSNLVTLQVTHLGTRIWLHQSAILHNIFKPTCDQALVD